MYLDHVYFLACYVLMAKLIYVEVLNRYTGEENGEAQNNKAKTKGSLLVNSYKSSIMEVANSSR